MKHSLNSPSRQFDSGRIEEANRATLWLVEYAGQEAEADHTIPRAVCPELQNQVMNLELLPASLNRAKSDKITDRARVFAKELRGAKLLSDEGRRAKNRGRMSTRG